MNMERIRDEMEAFRQESSREWYEGSAGLKEEIHTAAIFSRYPSLFSRENVEEVRLALAAAETSGKADAWRMRELWATLTLGFIREDLKELTDRSVNFEIGAKIMSPGEEEIPYRLSAILLLKEADRTRRAAIEFARMKVVAEKNEFLAPIHQRTHALAASLGYAGYLDMMGEVKPYPLAAVREEMERFLIRTEALYARELERTLQDRLGIPLSDARRHDVQHLFRAGEFDSHFPADRVVPAARAFCESMGLDLEAGGRIHMDIESRPRKSPRAFCSSVRVPEEVYLVISPHGGHDDYRSFLHELGHALHFAHVDPEASFEAKRLGDNSVTEGFAMLFDHLLLDSEWLIDFLGGGTGRYGRFLREHALFELYMLRRYAAKIDYELALHDGPDLTGKETLYAEILGRATLAAYPKESYLDDVDPFFYCANYLRAWMLQAQLAKRLISEFGRRWWREKGAGAYLRDLWRAGQGEDGDDLSARMGFDRLTSEPLAAQIEELLTAP